jgi:glucose-6-phosphate 1-dehydrogenase
MAGDPTLFHRADIVEAGWRAVDPILRAWEEDGDTIEEYPAGSWGPPSAEALLTRHGRAWRRPGT